MATLGALTYGDFSILPAFNSNACGPGNLVVAGTALIGSATNIQGTLTAVGNTTLRSTLLVSGASVFNAQSIFNDVTTFTSGLVTTSITDASSASTGAVQVGGGLGVARSSFLGGLLDVTGPTALHNTLNVTGNSSFTGQMQITNTTESTSAQTGALQVAGGIAAGGNFNSGTGNLSLGGNLILNSVPATGKTYLASPTNDLFINNAGTHDVYVNVNSTANFKVGNSIAANPTGLQVLVNADSTTPTNGSLIVNGGAGIAMTLNVGGDINAPIGQTVTVGNVVVTNTTDSSSITTGSFQTRGGGAFTKNVYVGEYLDVASIASTGSNIGSLRLLTGSSGSNWIQSSDVSRTSGNWTPLKFSPLGSTASILTVNGDQITVDTGTASTSAATGALVVTGGAGVSQDLYVGATSHFGGYATFDSNIWMNGKNIFLGAYNNQTHGLVLSDPNTGPLLFGLNSGALGTTTGTTKVALQWDSSQNVNIRGVLETTSSTTGALTVAGGIAAGKSVSIGASLYLQNTSWTSSGDDLILNAATSSIFLRNAVDSESGEFQSSPTAFTFQTLAVPAFGNTAATAPYSAVTVEKASGHVILGNTDDTSGSATGSFQTLGGVSIAKGLYVGADTTLDGRLVVNGTISTTGTNPVIFENTTDSSSVSTGSVVIYGGTGIGMNLYVGGLGRFVNTTNSTSPTTGAVSIAGGLGVVADVGIGGSVAIGTNLSVMGNVSVTSGTVAFANTTTSTSPTTGSFTAAGGVGVLGNMYLGGIANFVSTTASTSPTTGALVVTGGTGLTGDLYLAGLQRIVNNTESTSAGTGSFTTVGGVGIGKNLNVDGDTTINGTLSVAGNISSTGGTVHFTNTQDSAAPNGGSIVIDGGVGIAKSLFVGSPNNSTSPGSGGLVISGGLGIALDTFSGGNFTLTGTNPLVTFNNSNLSPPVLNTHSAGTRILLGAASGLTTSDYAIGLDTNVVWMSVPTNTGNESFTWYGGDSVAMNLTGAGILRINGTSEASSPTAGGTVQIQGGVGIVKSLYVGANLDVTGSSVFTGAVTAAANVTATGVLRVINTTNSTAVGNGSINTAGGLGVALNANIGQNLAVTGNSTFTGTVAVDGTAVFNNTLESTTAASGAVKILGGLAVAKNVNVGGVVVIGGSTTINGDLFVRGSRTEVNTSTLTTVDNVILVNSGPNASASSGIASKRYQYANDVAAGDVVNGDPPEITGTAGTGSTATTIVFDSDADATDGNYDGAWIVITAGTGAGQVRRVRSYVGATRTATIYSTADQAAADPVPVPVEGLDFTTVPAGDSVYAVFTSQYVVTVYDEAEREYTMGTTAINPVNDPNVTVRNRLQVHAGTLKLSQKLAVDTIENYNPGAGTTVEQVLVKQGTLSNVSLINGGVPDVTSFVELVDNDPASRQPLAGTQTSGSYMVMIKDVVDSGSSASFIISGSTQFGGSQSRPSSVPGSNRETLTVEWLAGEVPHLTFMNRPLNPTGSTYRYKLKVMAV